MEYWQHLLYPLGFLSALPFTARFLIQWIQSEKAKKSVVNPSFWIFSIFGNLTLTFHSILQIQYPVAIIQGLSAVLSYRNLSLMRGNPHQRSFKSVLLALAAVFFVITALFAAMGSLFYNGQMIWMRSPNFFWEAKPVSFFWHSIGFLGIVLFNGRFWIQWLQAERKQQSYLSTTFWVTSLVGAALCVLYFYQLGDLVNVIGPAVGMVTYSRNLMLLKAAPLQSDKV